MTVTARTAATRTDLARAVQTALHAPSVRNTQPWRWRIGSEVVELHADRYRHLAATDPDRRDLLLSCGAALHHLRVALAAEGFAVDGAVFLVLVTKGDTVLDRLRAGEAASAVLLTATRAGLATTPFSQAVEVDATRLRLRRDVLGVPEHPQLVLRVGLPASGAAPLPATPRRRLESVLLDPNTRMTDAG